jgi:hypothetical protein
MTKRSESPNSAPPENPAPQSRTATRPPKRLLAQSPPGKFGTDTNLRSYWSNQNTGLDEIVAAYK